MNKKNKFSVNLCQKEKAFLDTMIIGLENVESNFDFVIDFRTSTLNLIEYGLTFSGDYFFRLIALLLNDKLINGSSQNPIKTINYDKNGWKSIENFFFAANLRSNYVILRFWEDLNDLNKIDDIDILCENLLVFRNDTFSVKRSWGVSSYKVKINSLEISIDLRFVGDNYYDPSWQIKMLEKKIKKNYFYVLDQKNYFWSYLYHIIYHKKEVKKKEISYLISINNEIKNFDASMFDNANMYLNNFLKNNYFQITSPLDLTINIGSDVSNSSIFQRLKPPIKERVFLLTPIKVRKIYSKLKSLIFYDIKKPKRFNFFK